MCGQKKRKRLSFREKYKIFKEIKEVYKSYKFPRCSFPMTRSEDYLSLRTQHPKLPLISEFSVSGIEKSLQNLLFFLTWIFILDFYYN